jgi:hypothetical protein
MSWITSKTRTPMSRVQLILRHAKLVDEFQLADDIEPAPVFYA